MDETRDDLALMLQPDRDCPMRDAVQEVCRAIERVDDPAKFSVLIAFGTAFFHQETVTG